MKTLAELTAFIQQLLKYNEPVAFFVGAGISRFSPSHAPQWSELRDQYLSVLIEKALSVRADMCPDELLLRERAHREALQKPPKPELALSWLHRWLKNGLLESLKVLNRGCPNENHLSLAYLTLTNDVTLATSNFDLYLEQAVDLVGKAPVQAFASVAETGGSLPFEQYRPDSRSRQVSILKPHGTLAEPLTIRATLEQVSAPVEQSLKDAFRRFVLNRHVVLLGYSGNDYDLFDVIAEISPLARSVSWLVYGRYNERIFSLPRVTVVEGDLRVLLIGLNHSATQEAEVFGDQIVSPYTWLRNWANQLAVADAAYAVALYGMHVGCNDLVEELCKVVLEEEVSPAMSARAWNVLGISNKRRDPAEAMGCYEQAERQANKSDYESLALLGNIRGNRAALLHELGRHEEALTELNNSDQVGYQLLGASEWQCFAQRLLAANQDDKGNILRTLERPSQAIACHERAIEFRKDRGDLVGLALSLNNKALACVELGDLDKAESLFLESLDLKERETADLPAWVRGVMNLAEVRIRKGEIRDSRSQIEKAIGFACEIGDKIAAVRMKLDLAEILRQEGRVALALNCYQEALDQIDKTSTWFDDPDRAAWTEEIREKFLG